MECEICYDRKGTQVCEIPNCSHPMCSMCYAKLNTCPFCRSEYQRMSFKEYAKFTQTVHPSYRSYRHHLPRVPTQPRIFLDEDPENRRFSGTMGSFY